MAGIQAQNKKYSVDFQNKKKLGGIVFYCSTLGEAWAEVSRWKRPFGTTGEERFIMQVQNHQITRDVSQHFYYDSLKKTSQQVSPLSTHLDLE